jgi:hypothetical protein
MRIGPLWPITEYILAQLQPIWRVINVHFEINNCLFGYFEINNCLHLVLKEMVRFTFFTYFYGSCLNPLKWVLMEYCYLFSFILYLICIVLFFEKTFKRIHILDCLRKWCIDVSISAEYRYTYQWHRRRGGAPLLHHRGRGYKRTLNTQMILATRWWLLIYCSPLIQFHKKLGRKYLDSRHADLGPWHLFPQKKRINMKIQDPYSLASGIHHVYTHSSIYRLSTTKLIYK